MRLRTIEEMSNHIQFLETEIAVSHAEPEESEQRHHELHRKIILHANHNTRMVLVGVPDPDNPGSVDEAMLQSWHQEGIIEWWG